MSAIDEQIRDLQSKAEVVAEMIPAQITSQKKKLSLQRIKVIIQTDEEIILMFSKWLAENNN